MLAFTTKHDAPSPPATPRAASDTSWPPTSTPLSKLALNP
jgi:hypothetical protein